MNFAPSFLSSFYFLIAYRLGGRRTTLQAKDGQLLPLKRLLVVSYLTKISHLFVVRKRGGEEERGRDMKEEEWVLIEF